VIQILIADDHAVVRVGVKEILRREFKGVVCGEAGNAEEVLAQIGTRAWDLVIMDLSMPGRSGRELLRDLKRALPRLPVLILSMHPDGEYGRAMLEAGASGYLNKEIAPRELALAVRRALMGGVYVSPALAKRLASDAGGGQGPLPHDALSKRELEVLRMLASGKTASRIAAELHLSPATVSTYRVRILGKTKLTSTAELIRYAMRHFLVD